MCSFRRHGTYTRFSCNSGSSCLLLYDRQTLQLLIPLTLVSGCFYLVCFTLTSCQHNSWFRHKLIKWQLKVSRRGSLQPFRCRCFGQNDELPFEYWLWCSGITCTTVRVVWLRSSHLALKSHNQLSVWREYVPINGVSRQ